MVTPSLLAGGIAKGPAWNFKGAIREGRAIGWKEPPSHPGEDSAYIGL